ncbi:MAG: serine/threonine-protein kinase [Polyangiales bacterium]
MSEEPAEKRHDSSAFDATTDAASLDVTVLAPSGAASSGAASSAVDSRVAGSNSRTTVLPRVDAAGGKPQLVLSSRPRYEPRGLLGTGGVGEVVKTRDNDIDRTVAMKRLKADMRSPGHVARFVEEIRTIGLLEHPNIVPIHDVGIDDEGQYFFVMKLVEGETLESVLEKLSSGDRLYHGVYGFERRMEIFLGVLEAVAFAHAKGILHRDLKPANIMIGPFGEVMVMDWGLARRQRNSPSFGLDDRASAGPGDNPLSTQAGAILGTPAYMSPEQARGEPLDARSDIYSLSVMLHEMLCLRHYLADCKTVASVLIGVHSEHPKAASFVSNAHQGAAPMDLSHFARRGYEKDPSNRYQSVDEMIARLRRRAEGYIPIQCHVTLLKRLTQAWTHFIDRHPLIVTGLLLALIVWTLATTTWLFAHHGRG